MLWIFLALAGVQPTAAVLPAAQRLGSMLDPVDLSQFLLQQPTPHRPRHPLGDARAHHRHAARKPLQWGTCDENMTLLGSTCVCSASYYKATGSGLTTFNINGLDNYCSGQDTNTNFGLMCNPDVRGGQCQITGSAPNANNWPFTCMYHCSSALNANPYCLYGGCDLVIQTGTVKIDLEVERMIGGFKFDMWFNPGWGISDMVRQNFGVQIWVGNNGNSYNGAGNTLCFTWPTTTCSPCCGYTTTNCQFAYYIYPYYWQPSPLFKCLAKGRYFWIYQPGGHGGYDARLYWSNLKIMPPKECISGNCLKCETGKVSNPNAQSPSDCFINYGIDINASIGSVDYNYSSSQFYNLPAGYNVQAYSDDLDVFLDNCPAGYYCLSDTTLPTPCPAGTYRDALGGTLVGDCWACPAGHYCPIGSAEAIQCPAGRYRTTTGAQQPSDCALCPAGQFCPQGTVSPTGCPAGFFRDTAGATSTDDCVICPAGRFCTGTTSSPTVCAAGTYRESPGGASQSECFSCPTGHYCEAGTVTPTDCPAGTYRDAAGASASGNCLVCPAGKYCPVATTTPVSCPAGTFYTTTGADEPSDCNDCPTGYYCPAASVNPTACVAGTYRNGTAGTSADVCLPCTEGYYCLVGSTVPTECPGGTYRNILGATQSGECFSCPVGQYCGVATVSPTSCPAGTFRADQGASLVTDCLVCPVAQYCPMATHEPIDCPAGTFRAGTGGVNRASCTTCPTGNYCLQKVTAPTQCPAGTYRAATGANDVTDCLPCPNGQFCAQGTTTPTSCSAGTYLNGTGGASSADCVTCPPGQYCPVRTTIPIDCPAGTYRTTSGGTSQSSCSSCPAGSYCPLKSVTPTSCPAGMYRGASSAVAEVDCLPCPAGKFCGTGTVTPTSCAAGSYRSTSGAITQADCSICPAGAYCILGSISPTLCGPGRHRDTPGAVQLSNCLLCMPGTYSLDVGRSSDCPVCTANYYCRTSTLKESCPMNTKSAAGSYSRLNCKCNPGYSCTYYKRIQAIVSLNATVYDFNNNIDGVRTAFIAAIAAAANVTTNKVTINGVVARVGGGSRRLLSITHRMHQSADEPSIQEEFDSIPKQNLYIGSDLPEENFIEPPPAVRGFVPEKNKSTKSRSQSHEKFMSETPTANARSLLSVSGVGATSEAIKVFTTVLDAGRLNHLENHLARHTPGLFISHRWERHQTVQADKLG